MEVIVHAREQADTAFIRGVFQGVIVFRWLTLAYAAVGLIVSADEHLAHATSAALLLGLAFAYTAATTILFRRRFAALTHPIMVILEFVIAVALLVGDGFVYLDSRPQSLPWAWPAAAIITAAVVFGARPGIVIAVALGVASFIGEGLNSGGGRWGITASSKTGLYVLVAAVTGYVARRLRHAEQQVSVARAREEVSRTLHDGVLQTLAVVQRRATDPELAQLAREQDHELRAFLFGTGVDDQSLGVALLDAARRVERHHGLHAQVVVADDLPELRPDHVRALAGAVGEALTNAAKHSGADRLVVYAEPDDDGGVFCSVKDNGAGFDPDKTHAGQGLRRSIQGRMEDAGGRAEISSRPDWGTEVRLWVG